MTDREKRIIQEFEWFIQEYDRDIGFATHDKEVLMDVLALLKAQEPVKPTWRRGLAFCSSCGRQFCHGFKYCPDCGRPVKWE